MSPRIPENVSMVNLSLATVMRATRIPPRDPNDDDEEEDDDADTDDDQGPAVIREPDEDE